MIQLGNGFSFRLCFWGCFNRILIVEKILRCQPKIKCIRNWNETKSVSLYNVMKIAPGNFSVIQWNLNSLWHLNGYSSWSAKNLLHQSNDSMFFDFLFLLKFQLAGSRILRWTFLKRYKHEPCIFGCNLKRTAPAVSWTFSSLFLLMVLFFENDVIYHEILNASEIDIICGFKKVAKIMRLNN